MTGDYLHRKLNVLAHSRRFFLGTALLAGLTATVARPAALVRPAAPLRPERSDGQANPGLLSCALDALEQHRGAIAGAYRTGDFYVSAHGDSVRLDGLDPTNSNASSRAIVVHSAWYVSEAMAGTRDVLGRSGGCFAVAGSSLDDVMTRLGPGRLIYAGKA